MKRITNFYQTVPAGRVRIIVRDKDGKQQIYQTTGTVEFHMFQAMLLACQQPKRVKHVPSAQVSE